MTNSITLQGILLQHLGDYGQSHKLDGNRLKVCGHLLACHTPALGGMSYQCDHCESEIPLYHSCRDRHCPQCQNRASQQWRDKQQQAALPVTYYHLVFTLPHALNGWVQLHPEVIYALLFKAVWKTLKAFGADPKRMNGKLGMTAVLHTWGQTLSQHVHLHCLVPGGALDKDQHWHPAKSNYLFPVKALSRHYRGNLVSALRSCAKKGKLSRITNPDEIDSVLNQLMQKDWVVYSKHCLNRTDSTVGYLARYTHRIAISDQRIIDIDQDRVRFHYKDNRDELPDLYAEASPAFHISADDPPVFLYHGKQDDPVTRDQAVDYYQALLANGIDAELYLHAWRGHATMFVFGGDAEDKAITFLNRKNALTVTGGKVESSV